MTAFVSTRGELAALDRRIAGALVALRAARAASARLASQKNLAYETRAEADLNALLEYRHAAQQVRTAPAP